MKKSRSSYCSPLPLWRYCFLPALLRAQLVRSRHFPPAQSSEVATQPPSGKRRIPKSSNYRRPVLVRHRNRCAPGEHIVVTATGNSATRRQEDNGPDGITRSSRFLRILPFNGAGHGALIGRVGDAEIAQPFLLGASRDVTAPVAGRLTIVSSSQRRYRRGHLHVHIEIHAPIQTRCITQLTRSK